MRIYTRTGDRGETHLFGGVRVPKDHPRVEAYGTVDELNSILGLVRAKLPAGDLQTLLTRVQSTLFQIGAELATARPDDAKLTAHLPRVEPEQVTELERWIDRLDTELVPLRAFILPGGSEVAALLHVARTVARRAERRVVALSRTESLNPEILRYLNRLSDLLFVAARWLNKQAGTEEIPWEPGR